MTTLVVVLALIVAGAGGLWAYRRSGSRPTRAHQGAHGEKPGEKHEAARRARNHPGQSHDPASPHAKPQVKQWGVRIAVPAQERACPQVRPLLGKEFPLDEKPPLPVLNCPFPQQCECRYVKLFDRRKGERRSGQERRQIQRFEPDHPPRRSGKDRRKGKDVDWT